MNLRTRLNLVVAGLTAAFVIVLVVAQFRTARASVREEIAAANRVATQLLRPLAVVYSQEGGPRLLLQFLEQLGRVRANDISLESATGQVYYRSPPPTWKAGREVPEWFERLLAPPPARQTFPMPQGVWLVVEANSSRALLDAWDDFARLAGVALIMLVVVNGFAFWSVNREAREAETRLEERRELAHLVEQRVEEERRLIAHELHDEFGQSVTAIRSLALAIATQAGAKDPATDQAARLISQEAGSLYDAMHGLIPRLMPLSLDTLGLAETLEGLVRDWQRRHPAIALTVRHELSADLGPSLTLAIYRVVQEGLINALRHAQASNVDISVRTNAGRAVVSIEDDGVGLPADWSRPGHFGLRGLRERVERLGGVLNVGKREPRGTRLTAEIPLQGRA